MDRRPLTMERRPLAIERPHGTPVPSPLAGVIDKLVDRATNHIITGVDQAEAVDDLVAASRWNPALLMVATKQASRMADTSSGEHLEPAVDILRAAEQRVRQRAY